MGNASLQDLSKMAKESRGTSDISTDVSSNITAVRWKDNNCKWSIYIHWKRTNSVCKKIL